MLSSMTSLTTFPTKILTHIISSLSTRLDLAHCRLVNRRLNSIATPLYFSSVALYADWAVPEPEEVVDLYANWTPPNEEPKWPKRYHEPRALWPNDVGYDAHMFEKILEGDRLKGLVKNVCVWTCNPDCDHKPTWANGFHDDAIFMDDGMPEGELSAVWTQCLKRLSGFEKLWGVSLVFDRHGGERDDIYVTDLFQGRGTRAVWMDELFKVLWPMGSRIKKLSIRHFEDELGEDGEDGEVRDRRERVLGGLEGLRVAVVSEQVIGEGDPILKGGDGGHIHRFWAQFPSRWLRPASRNLRRLVLYADMPIGWFPRLDLTKLHFDIIKSLTLGHFTFSKDAQFDWILSHRAALKELNLDRCSIIHQIFHAREGDWITQDGYPDLDLHGGHRGRYSFSPEYENIEFNWFYRVVNYETRWHDVFDKFRLELHHLHTFRFGNSSQWDFDTPCRFDDGVPGLPVVSWEAEIEIKNEMCSTRYLHYDDWACLFKEDWEREDDDEDEEVEFDPELLAGRKDPPECDAEDWEALERLLGFVGRWV